MKTPVLQKSKLICFIFILVLSIIGFGTVLFSTRFGIGIQPDSVSYIDAARNLLRGDGFFVTYVHGEREALTQSYLFVG